MKRLTLALCMLLVPALALAQQVDMRPAPGSVTVNAAAAFPLQASDGCTAPLPFSFTNDTDAGMCRGLAAQWAYDSTVIQSGDYESDFQGAFFQLAEGPPELGFMGATAATGNGASVYFQAPGGGFTWSNVVLNASNFTTGTGASGNLELNASDAGVGFTRITVDSDAGLQSVTDFLADRSTFTDPVHLPNGTLANPALAFVSDPDAGVRYDNGFKIEVPGATGRRWLDLDVADTGQAQLYSESNTGAFSWVNSSSNDVQLSAIGGLTSEVVQLNMVTDSANVRFNTVVTDGGGSTQQISLEMAGFQVVTQGAKPTCNVTNRGRIWRVEGGAGVADTFELCAKNSGDTYAWYSLATIP
jgi:hypothetical protein